MVFLSLVLFLFPLLLYHIYRGSRMLCYFYYLQIGFYDIELRPREGQWWRSVWRCPRSPPDQMHNSSNHNSSGMGSLERYKILSDSPGWECVWATHFRVTWRGKPKAGLFWRLVLYRLLTVMSPLRNEGGRKARIA